MMPEIPTITMGRFANELQPCAGPVGVDWKEVVETDSHLTDTGLSGALPRAPAHVRDHRILGSGPYLPVREGGQR